MNNQILNDNTVLYYVVRVNGQNMSIPTTTKAIAEMEKMKLAPELQMIAEIVPVTADGKQMLLE
jgi:hypothetical protein